jgi:hypothetical protein
MASGARVGASGWCKRQQTGEEHTAAGEHGAPETEALPEGQELHLIITVALSLLLSVRVVDDQASGLGAADHPMDRAS